MPSFTGDIGIDGSSLGDGKDGWIDEVSLNEDRFFITPADAGASLVAFPFMYRGRVVAQGCNEISRYLSASSGAEIRGSPYPTYESHREFVRITLTVLYRAGLLNPTAGISEAQFAERIAPTRTPVVHPDEFDAPVEKEPIPSNDPPPLIALKWRRPSDGKKIEKYKYLVARMDKIISAIGSKMDQLDGTADHWVLYAAALYLRANAPPDASNPGSMPKSARSLFGLTKIHFAPTYATSWPRGGAPSTSLPAPAPTIRIEPPTPAPSSPIVHPLPLPQATPPPPPRRYVPIQAPLPAPPTVPAVPYYAVPASPYASAAVTYAPPAPSVHTDPYPSAPENETGIASAVESVYAGAGAVAGGLRAARNAVGDALGAAASLVGRTAGALSSPRRPSSPPPPPALPAPPPVASASSYPPNPTGAIQVSESEIMARRLQSMVARGVLSKDVGKGAIQALRSPPGSPPGPSASRPAAVPAASLNRTQPNATLSVVPINYGIRPASTPTRPALPPPPTRAKQPTQSVIRTDAIALAVSRSIQSGESKEQFKDRIARQVKAGVHSNDPNNYAYAEMLYDKARNARDVTNYPRTQAPRAPSTPILALPAPPNPAPSNAAQKRGTTMIPLAPAATVAASPPARASSVQQPAAKTNAQSASKAGANAAQESPPTQTNMSRRERRALRELQNSNPVPSSTRA